MKSIDLKLRAQWTRELATDLQEAALMKEWNDITRTSSRRSKVCKIYES